MMWFESSKNPPESGTNAGPLTNELDERKKHAPRLILHSMLALVVLLVAACGAFSFGKLKWIEKTDSDEKFYLLKQAYLSGGSPQPRTSFDHTILDTVYLIFVPANEKGHYVTKSVWYDPSGAEFRTIRETHDRQEETSKGEERNEKKGTTRMHSISLLDLYHHMPGRWKVKLYIDSDLARKLDFSVR